MKAGALAPAPLERIISRLIEPDRKKRYATTSDLAADFDRLDDPQ